MQVLVAEKIWDRTASWSGRIGQPAEKDKGINENDRKLCDIHCSHLIEREIERRVTGTTFELPSLICGSSVPSRKAGRRGTKSRKSGNSDAPALLFDAVDCEPLGFVSPGALPFWR